MPRLGTFLYQVSVADGFADDCDELILRCSKKEPLTYHYFCKLWKEMKFRNIYKGRSLNAEVAELSEELLHIAKRYFTMDTSNFEESVAGLFLVYALYNLQPYPGFASLRLTPEDMASINWIQTMARRERRFDVLYILGSVLVKASQYHVTSRERGFDCALTKYLNGCTSFDKNGVRPKGVLLRQNEEMDLLREITTLGEKYKAAKLEVTSCEGLGAKYQFMDYVNLSTSAELTTSLKNLINGMLDDEEDKRPESAIQQPTAASTAQEIKQRAMKSAVGTVKHLTSLEERTAKGNKTQKCETKFFPGRVKTGRRTKLATSRSPREKESSPIPSTSKESPMGEVSLEASPFPPQVSSRGRTYMASRGRSRGAKSPRNRRSLVEIEVPPLSSDSSSDLSPVSIKSRQGRKPKQSPDKPQSNNEMIEVTLSNIPSTNVESANRSPKVAKKGTKSKSALLDSLFSLDTSNEIDLPSDISKTIPSPNDSDTSKIPSLVNADNNKATSKSNLKATKDGPSSTEASLSNMGDNNNPSPRSSQDKHISSKTSAKSRLLNTSLPGQGTPKESLKIVEQSNTTSIKKSKNTKPPKRSKRRRKVSSSESSEETSESDISALIDSDSDLDVSDDKLTDDDDDDNSNEKDVTNVKVYNNSDKLKGKVIGQAVLGVLQENKNPELEIEIESLPILIRNEEDGSMIQIPVPDDDNQNQNDLVDKPETDVRVLRSRLKFSKDVTLSKINQDNEVLSVDKCSQHYHSMAKISKVRQTKSQPELSVVTRSAAALQGNENPKLKRPDKREQKKTLVKSKFSRMGILPIANFEDK